MNIKDLIRAEKTEVDLGTWAEGHIPRSSFPMSKLTDKRYKYGSEYKWRVVKFIACGYSCRILVQLNESKEIMRARCGAYVDGDMIVLCSHEFHASEPGWHCHVTFDPVTRIPPGSARNDKRKWPRSIRDEPFTANKENALTVVAAFFGLRDKGGLV